MVPKEFHPLAAAVIMLIYGACALQNLPKLDYAGAFKWTMEALFGFLIFSWPVLVIIAYVLGGLLLLWIGVRIVRHAWRS